MEEMRQEFNPVTAINRKFICIYIHSIYTVYIVVFFKKHLNKHLLTIILH